MKKFFLFVASSVLCAQAFAIELPEEFYVTERWISLTTTFDIETKGEKLGCVWRKFFSWTPEYHLQNNQEEIVAKGRMRFFSFLPYFDVTDADESPLGTVEERFTWFYPTFDVVSPAGQKMAQAVMNFWGTRYDVNDPIDGHLLATLSRPFFRLKNNWTANVIDRATLSARGLHPHMFLIVMAFQVDREYWAAINARNERNRQQQSSQAYPISFSQALAHTETKPMRPALFNELSAFLKQYEEILEAAEPEEKDFLFVDGLADRSSLEADEEAFAKTAGDLMLLFESETLTQRQKAALFLMLKHRLEKKV